MRDNLRFAGVIGSLLVLGMGCTFPSATPENPPLFRKIDPEYSHLNFSNTLEESEALHILSYEYFYNGAGVGIGDFDLDGLPDLFFSSNQGESKLYKNKGAFRFEDISTEAGIETLGKWGTGVSLVDINADGWLDIYLCVSGPYPPNGRRNSFFINQGDGTFVDKAKELGLDDSGPTIQAAFFDFDLDGDLDVYLLNNVTFGLGPNVIRPKQDAGQAPSTDKLFENIDGKFVDVSQSAGIVKEGYGLGISIRDVNEDGWPDVFISNDYLSNDLLYINQGDRTFVDRLSAYVKHTSYSAMGNDIADINNDGLQDIIEVDMLPPDHRRRKLMINSINYDRHRSEILSGYTPQVVRNSLQLNQGIEPQKGHPVFSEVGQMYQVSATDWSWAPLLVDMDNDGYKDIFITNGYPRDITHLDFVAFKVAEMAKQVYSPDMQSQFLGAIQDLEGAYLPNYVFHNQGSPTSFAIPQNWGLKDSSYSHGAAFGDLDQDGDLDLVVNNTYHPAFVYENTTEGKHFLQIQLKGPRQNIQGIGAKVYVYQKESMQMQEFHPVRGYQSTMEPIIHFGLASHKEIDSLVVHWPGGKKTSLPNVEGDQRMELSYESAQPFKASSPSTTPFPLLKEVSKALFEEHLHEEAHFPDFHVQPLIPQKYSQLGPGIAVGDIQGDGDADLFVGGGFKQTGVFFTSTPSGRWKRKPLTDGISFEEDMGCLLFDSDQDGDQDLYVVSGGNEFAVGSPYYQDRLYRNTGNGDFVLDSLALPHLPVSGSCVLGEDIDQDGDIDVFVGGRLTPQSYPLPGISQVLENRGGNFFDITEEKFPGLRDIGRVSSALWTDINEDSQVDLLVVGEWMAIELFIREGDKWTRKTPSGLTYFPNDSVPRPLTQTVGWWNSVQGGDFDRDGDIDYILGNLGLNTPLQTSLEEPVSLYYADFDGDGKKDPILCHYLEGIEAPYHPKDDLQKQVFDLRRKFPRYAHFAQAAWSDFFPQFPLEELQILSAQIFESIYLEKIGPLAFRIHYLPKEAQMAPVHGIGIQDVNQDGFLDALLTGNSFSFEPMAGALDAFQGLVLLGNGSGEFSPQSLSESGWYIPGDGKSLALLPLKSSWGIAVAENKGPLRIFSPLDPSPGNWISPPPGTKRMRVEYIDGSSEVRELFRGGGYLSQSAHGIWVDSSIVRITVEDTTIFSTP